MKRKYKLLSGAKQALFVFALTLFSATAYSQTYTLNYTGSVQTLNLGAGTYSIECWGGDGYTQTAGYNGKGGYASGILTLGSAQTIYIYVGGLGSFPSAGVSANAWTFNGGGIGYPANNALYGNGGGASDVRTVGGLWDNSTSLASRAIVAGGGGAGRNTSYIGGNAGGLTGGTGTFFTPDQTGGPTGGSQTAGGTNTGYTSGLTLATLGKAMTWDGNTLTANFLAGGGGGYYGGGSGRVAGGGGSSYIGGVTGGTTVMYGQTGFVANPVTTGDGRVLITSLCNISVTNASTTGPGPICSGNSATIATNAISNYVWSNGNTSSSIVVSPTVTTSYTLTATSPSNCTASAVITITVQNGNPTVTAVTNNTAVCAGQPVILTASGANTYTWTGGATNAVSYTPAATGGYTVTGANACGTGTAAVSVTVNSSPTVFGGSSSATVCNGTAVTFTSGGNATTYAWTNGVVSGVPYTPAATNNYTLTGTANGCSSITVVGVTVLVTPNSPPVVTPTAICLGGTATLSAVGAAGYTWTPGSNLFTASLTVSPPVPTTYTLFRNNGACSSTMTVGLVVNPLPLVNATASPSQICTGTGVNLVVVGPISNVWLPGGFTQGNFTVYPNFSTNYTVTGSNGNCTASAVVPVIVNPTPTLGILTSTNTICEGQNVTLTGTGGLTYLWLPSGLTNTVETASPNATSLFTLTGTNSFNCSSSITQVIVVNPAPNMALLSNIPFLCVGNTASISIANQASNVVYNWNTGPVGPSIMVSPSVTTSYSATGTNTITGCQNTNTIALAVYISTFVVTSPTAICNGQTATFSATGDATSYSWTASGGPIGTGVPSVTVSPVISTNYTVTGSNGSCESKQSVNLIVHQLPNVTATAVKGQICKFEIATINAAGASTYTWDTGSGLISNTQTLTFTLSVTTTYTLTGTDNNSCSRTATVTQYVATCIGIENLSANDLTLNIYPNPNNGSFVISSDVKLDLQMVNALGQKITTFNLNEGEKEEITVNNLPAGIYFISGQSGDVKINKKVVVER